MSTYASANLGGYISQPLIDLNAAVDNFYNPTSGGNAPLVDYFNPNWETFIQGLILNFNPAITNGNYRSPKFMGTPGDDTDFTKLPDAGDHFHTIPISHQSVDPALQVMVTSPLMTLEAVPTAYHLRGGLAYTLRVCQSLELLQDSDGFASCHLRRSDYLRPLRFPAARNILPPLRSIRHGARPVSILPSAAAEHVTDTLIHGAARPAGQAASLGQE